MNSFKIYHTVGTVSKYTTLSEQFQNIPHCGKCSKIYHTVGTVVWYILKLFRQCGISWNISHSVVYFETVPTVWYILKLFRQCGIFWNCSDSEIYNTVGTVRNISHCRKSFKIHHTVGKVSKYTTLSEQFQNMIFSNSVVYFETVTTVWCILKLFRQCGVRPFGIFWNCSESGKVSKYTTLSEQFQNIPHCRNSFKIYHTVGTVSKYTIF
jgi:hypothetical protein